MFRLLRQRNFALLWFGGLISIMGDWVLGVALQLATEERLRYATEAMKIVDIGGPILLALAGIRS